MFFKKKKKNFLPTRGNHTFYGKNSEFKVLVQPVTIYFMWGKLLHFLELQYYLMKKETKIPFYRYMIRTASNKIYENTANAQSSYIHIKKSWFIFWKQNFRVRGGHF